MLAPLIAQGLRELPQGSFGSCVGGNCDATLEGEEGTKVYDPPLSPRNHVTAGSLRKEPDGLEIDV